MLKNTLIIFIALQSLITLKLWAQNEKYDVIIYGATPSGIAAAINAAGEGVTVALIEETEHIGGLTSSGLLHTDFLSYESLGGTWREFMRRVEKHYIDTYGPNSQQVIDSWKGAYYEPKVAKKVFKEMLGEHDNLKVILEHRLVSASTSIIKGTKTKLQFIRVKDLKDNQLEDYHGKVFIDASYEGDLIAAAGAEYTVGSEGPEKYDEPSATPKDWHVQCYNFRVTLTKNSENRLPIPKPDKYNSDDFQILIEGMKNGEINELDDIIRGPVRQVPNEKADFNDKKGSKMSFKICNETDVWPEGTTEVRQQVWEQAKELTLGLFYFLTNDERVLSKIQEEIKPWGLPKDEFEEYGHWPPLIYVREGRRLVGEYVYTENDGKVVKGSVRAPAFEKAIAIGDYNFNSHGTYYTCGCNDRELLGNTSSATRPWQVPYPVILPKDVDGLLAPVPVSASRVGYGAIRMEPTWTALGQAAGLAAAQAVKNKIEPRNIRVDKLQEKLHDLGALTFYTSDIPPGTSYFKAVQYFGNRGLFQDLYDPDKVQNLYKRPKKLSDSNENQWTEAFPYHDIQPEKKMETDLAENWLKKLDVEDEKLIKQARRMTRGEFLNRLYQIKLSSPK